MEKEIKKLLNDYERLKKGAGISDWMLWIKKAKKLIEKVDKMEKEEIVCPVCGSKDVKHLVGEIWVCRDCGAEFSIREWNTPENKSIEDLNVEEENIKQKTLNGYE